MNQLEKLAELFTAFPGIGPRQAKRFVYFLLRQNIEYATTLSQAINDIKKNVKVCKDSFVFFYTDDPTQTLSPIARDQRRDDSLLMVVEKDVDLENIEKTHAYKGRYFVLGGALPILEKEPEKRIRLRELISLITRKESDIQEIIIATNANPDGDNTSDFVTSYIKKSLPKASFKISHFGRGLSTGTELEYSDGATIEQALKNRI